MYDNTLKISLPHIKQEVPVFVLFRALGCISDKEIIYHIIDNDDSKIDRLILKMLKSTIDEGSLFKLKKKLLIIFVNILITLITILKVMKRNEHM